MTTSAPIYPAYTFAKSPTYNVWSRLSCVDIHALRSTPGFEGQNLYFHLNHPIRFVRLVGTVTEIDALGTRLGGVPLFIFLTVDDGSGATVTVKIKRVRTDNDGRARDEVERLGGANTEVAALNAVEKLGANLTLCFDEKEKIDVGTRLKCKGTIEVFRGTKQLDLKRVSVVRDLAAEVECWNELADFREKVLSKPWALSEKELRRLERETKRMSREEREKESRRRNGRREKMRMVSERTTIVDEEAERGRMLEEMGMDEGALKGSEKVGWGC